MNNPEQRNYIDGFIVIERKNEELRKNLLLTFRNELLLAAMRFQ
jgi:hypothetical protein